MISTCDAPAKSWRVNSPHDLPNVRRELRKWLSTLGVDHLVIENVALVTTEAVANSLQHGYLDSGPVDIRVAIAKGSQIEVQVRDRGQWNGFAARPDGRGLLLVRALADTTAIDTGPKGTTVTMALRDRSIV